ncbi:WD40/YVTN/BNR-like repeat-containing protein [Amphritea pacifica]|uniref:Photosystem I reaction center subunit IV n=1 Tax=Amphritea pacifica TaxID=2811233 RepID=A0ABS2W4S8_9GAMM|nr:YCF48-related protein [Amphritea pacifica]MBN0986517.1 photosystem I reaction center subunit IV [Amphritea pacifica]MBN1006159.1 photosystem I reaction center subunit IV [Amphritea pacifica]
MDLIRSLTGFIIVSATLMAGAAVAQSGVDRLTTPALPSYRAAQTLLLDIAASGNQLVAVGDQGVVMRSTDQGQSWQQQLTPFSVMLTSVCFADAQHGWLTGHDGLLAATDDGGVNWHLLLDGNQINQLRLQRLQQKMAELQAQLDVQPDNAQLAEQLDNVSWQAGDAAAAVDDGAGVPLLDIWFSDSQRGFALGGYGLLLKTEDGGDSWAYWGDRLDNPDNFHLNAMKADHRGYLYIVGEAGLLFRSEDGGDHWQRIETPYDGSFFGITEFNSQLYLMGLRGHLFRSADGLEWLPVETGHAATLVSAVTEAQQLVLLGQGGLILQSADGQHFSQLPSGGRHSLSAGLALNGGYVLVGEGGLHTLEAAHE